MLSYELSGRMTLAFVNNPTALLIVLLVIVLLFGGKNIPDLMKGLGQGMREFKKGMKSEEEPRPTPREEVEARIRAEVEREVRARSEAERQHAAPGSERYK